jgi:hypothetical protein
LFCGFDNFVHLDCGSGRDRVDLDVDGRRADLRGFSVIFGVDERNSRESGLGGAEIDGFVPDSEGEDAGLERVDSLDDVLVKELDGVVDQLVLLSLEDLDVEVEFVLQIDELFALELSGEEEVVRANGRGRGDEGLREGLSDRGLRELVERGDVNGDLERMERLELVGFDYLRRGIGRDYCRADFHAALVLGSGEHILCGLVDVFIEDGPGDAVEFGFLVRLGDIDVPDRDVKLGRLTDGYEVLRAVEHDGELGHADGELDVLGESDLCVGGRGHGEFEDVVISWDEDVLLDQELGRGRLQDFIRDIGRSGDVL